MSSGASGSDENISGSKIQPLDSETKYNVPHDTSAGGVVGTDSSIDQARIDPVGGRGQYQHPAPHADSQGSIGRDETLQGAKIEPLGRNFKTVNDQSQGLDDEAVDTARINPMGEVREELS